MNHEFWRTAWARGQASQSRGCTSLELEWLTDRLEINETSVGLFPFCGAAPEVAELSKRCAKIVCVDVVEAAVEKMLRGIVACNAQVLRNGNLRRASNIEMFIEDFFTFSYEERFDWVFDDGGFISVDPSRRARYLDHVASLLRPGGRAFIRALHASYCRPPRVPPFLIEKSEFRELVHEAWRARVGHEDMINREFRSEWTYAGAESVTRTSWLLERKSMAKRR